MENKTAMFRIILITIIGISISCRKEETDKNLSVVELLTQKPWVLTSYGTDENGNGLIDAAEESIEDCQKDNTWFYYADGTGFFDELDIAINNSCD